MTVEASQMGVKESSARSGFVLSEAKMVRIACTILCLLRMHACQHGHIKSTLFVLWFPCLLFPNPPDSSV